MVGPVLVPVIAALLFFGGLGALALQTQVGGWGLHLLLLGLGALIALPLVDQDDDRSSLAVGLALRVGLLELMVDAFSRHCAELPDPPHVDPVRGQPPRMGTRRVGRPAHRRGNLVGGCRGP